jgi:hypothetical protein
MTTALLLGPTRAGTPLLATALAFLTAGYTLLGLAREPLAVLGEIDARYLGPAVALLCAVLVPLYALSLRHWSRARVAAAVTIMLVLCTGGTFALAALRSLPAPACSLVMGLAPFALLHVWSIASDVPAADGLRALPWLALGASVGAILPRLFAVPMWAAVGPAGALAVAAVSFLVGGMIVVGHDRGRGEPARTSPASATVATPPSTGLGAGLRDRHLWIAAGLAMAVASLEALTDVRGWFPSDGSRWPRAALLAAGALGVLLLAVPLLRRSLLLLLLLWPAGVVVVALLVVTGASPSAIAAGDWPLAVTSTVTAVAAQAVLLGSPRGARYVGRAFLAFLIAPVGTLVGPWAQRWPRALRPACWRGASSPSPPSPQPWCWVCSPRDPWNGTGRTQRRRTSSLHRAADRASSQSRTNRKFQPERGAGSRAQRRLEETAGQGAMR